MKSYVERFGYQSRRFRGQVDASTLHWNDRLYYSLRRDLVNGFGKCVRIPSGRKPDTLFLIPL
ncbi:hypothetical protein ACLMJV_00380 [Sinorhizobium meliloti]|uniref:hypothetical protein n=1 Tax=Rhizobium meliloti TaxID=382 RepID=UPI00398D089A